MKSRNAWKTHPKNAQMSLFSPGKRPHRGEDSKSCALKLLCIAYFQV